MKDHEEAVSQLHAETAAEDGIDAYINYRVGFSEATIQPYIDIFAKNNEPYSLSADGQHMLVYAPNGYTFELFTESTTAFDIKAANAAIIDAAQHK